MNTVRDGSQAVDLVTANTLHYELCSGRSPALQGRLHGLAVGSILWRPEGANNCQGQFLEIQATFRGHPGQLGPDVLGSFSAFED